MTITILTEQDLRSAVGIDEESLAAVADGFTRLAQGKATMPPVMRVDVPEHNGELDVKSAYLQGLDSFAVKLSSGFFDNEKLDLPSLGGLMILLSSRTGFPQAILLDNGYLTDVRTAMAGALAARHVAQSEVGTVGVIGSGAQARYQVRALQLVCQFKQVLVYSRNPAHVERYVEEMPTYLGVTVEPASSAEALVRRSDLVVTTTPARTPVIRADWLHPGLHITAMGSDAETKQELEASILARADVLVCDTRAQALRLGELHHAHAAGLLEGVEDVIELGELTASGRNARTNSDQISVCDLTGTGVQDTAIARLAYKKARAAELGLEIESSG